MSKPFWAARDNKLVIDGNAFKKDRQQDINNPPPVVEEDDEHFPHFSLRGLILTLAWVAFIVVALEIWIVIRMEPSICSYLLGLK